MSAFLQTIDLTKRYGANTALAGVTLDVEHGSVLAVLGPNGAGKSTLFGCLLGLTTRTSGQVRVNGLPVSDATRARFGYLAERVAVYPQRTVSENATFFARVKGMPSTFALQQLERVGLHAVKDRPARHLSKGMLQRLGLAIALCGQPELLILDEPFNGLDPAWLDTLQAILKEEHARGATLLISTHTISAIEPLATQVAVLLSGRMTAHESVGNLRAEFCDCTSLATIYHQIAGRECSDRLGKADNQVPSVHYSTLSAK